MPKIRILIADDHAMVRSGLKLLIERQPDMEVVAEASDGAMAVAAALRARPHVVLLDLSMPSTNGVEALRQLADVIPAARILVISAHESTDYVRAALTAGAAGYLAKRAADRDLIHAIRAVHAGSSYVDVRLALGLAAIMGGRADAGAAELSRRERQVLEQLALGHTNREIASKLKIGIKSVETYRARLRQKLGVSTRAELVRAAGGVVTADEEKRDTD